MLKRCLVIMMLLVQCGCAALRSSDGGIMKRFSQSRSLAEANSQLEAGDRAGAAKTLTRVVEAGSYSGITDEALFTLALLDLRPAGEHDSNARALQLLKRLVKEYPASPWTQKSRQLLELLTGIDDLRRQVKTLKSSNQSLSGELKELNRNVDQLKRLDQELEKQRR
jgi:outer membrane protein assembly factor BamD (BamD/ComL family)